MEGPLLGAIEEGTGFYPTGGGIGGGQSMDILACGGLPAVVDGVDLPETGYVPLFAGVEGAYGDTAFQGSKRSILYLIGLYGGFPKTSVLEDKRSLSSYLEFRGKSGLSAGFSKSLFQNQPGFGTRSKIVRQECGKTSWSMGNRPVCSAIFW
ncbi:MAG: hypothetical protein LBU19_06675 [Treponema sp.]|jgi:hypothetical protein|nr:hypothetical protein [Treponema sp.]